MKSLVQKSCAIFVIQIDYFIAKNDFNCCQRYLLLSDHNDWPQHCGFILPHSDLGWRWRGRGRSIVGNYDKAELSLGIFLFCQLNRLIDAIWMGEHNKCVLTQFSLKSGNICGMCLGSAVNFISIFITGQKCQKFFRSRIPPFCLFRLRPFFEKEVNFFC